MAKQQRDPAKEALWRKTLQRFAASGLSVREFCKREQVTESAFYAWRRTIGERDEVGNSEPAFVPAVINGEAQHDESLVLALASGLKLHFPPATPAKRVAELVRALQSQPES
jgi:transposase-like protein